MEQLIDREKPFSELPADAPIFELRGPVEDSWTYAEFSPTDCRIERYFLEDGNIVTEYYRLPPLIVKLLRREARAAREGLQRELRILLGV